MPVIEEKNKEKRKKLRLGDCIKNVSIDKIISLLQMSYKKLEIDFDEKILKESMQKNEHFLKRIKEPEEYENSKDEILMIEMVYKNYTQIVRVMIELGAKLDLRSRHYLKFQESSKQEKNSSLFKIAYRSSNYDILALLMIHKEKGSSDE